jgi:hypothetical protein
MKVQKDGTSEEILWHFLRYGCHDFLAAVESNENRSPPDHGCVPDVPSSFSLEIMHRTTYFVKGLAVQFLSISGRNILFKYSQNSPAFLC